MKIPGANDQTPMDPPVYDGTRTLTPDEAARSRRSLRKALQRQGIDVTEGAVASQPAKTKR